MGLRQLPVAATYEDARTSLIERELLAQFADEAARPKPKGGCEESGTTLTSGTWCTLRSSPGLGYIDLGAYGILFVGGVGAGRRSAHVGTGTEFSGGVPGRAQLALRPKKGHCTSVGVLAKC